MRPELDPAELSPADIRTKPSGFCGLLDDLRACEFELNLGELHRLQKAATFGQWELVKNTSFQEIHIKSRLGRVATIQVASGKLSGQTVPTEQHEANGLFIVLLQNNADWLIRASRFALQQGFRP